MTTTFAFSAYTVDNKTRFLPAQPNAPLNVQVGDFTALVGYDVSNLQNRPGQTIFLTMWWQSIKSTPTDYSVFIHLWDPVQQKLIGNWGGQPVTSAFSVWQGVAGAHFSVAYPTRVWEPGEIIKDEWKLGIPVNTPTGTL